MSDKSILSTGHGGFTLVEILVAIIILSVGILAVSQMTVMGMKVNTVVNNRIYARVVMAQLFENLNTLPSTHAWLLDTNSSTDLTITDSLAADHYQRMTDPNTRHSYLTVWNIADNVPELNLKTVRLFIMWGPTLQNSISSDLIKRM